MSRETPCFTINACNRCRRRKARCDPDIPSCSSCRKTGSVCEYTDSRSKKVVPRSYILSLEDELRRLESAARPRPRRIHGEEDPQADGLRNTSSTTDSVHHESRVPPDLIQLEPGEDAHFLGVSSGMHLARSVLESAQQNGTHFQSSSHSEQSTIASPFVDQLHDTPHEAGATWPVMPSRDTAASLVDIFRAQYEVQYPIVIGDEMLDIISEFYDENGPSRTTSDAKKDPWNQFILNMVFAVSLVVLSRENPEAHVLAKSFSAAAMADLSTIMQRKSVRTLQCLLLLLLWSILHPSSAPIWYISGLSMRMCVDLGFHSEATIETSSQGSAVEHGMDVKRRLFWVTYTFDRTLGTLLGRPFTLNDSLIDVQLPAHSLPDKRRSQIIHWLKLQQLQSQIVYRLYSMRDDRLPHSVNENNNITRWKSDMAVRLRQWAGSILGLADPNGLNLDWWEYWHQNAVLLLHRPSPLKPSLDGDEAEICYTAAQNMIQLSFTRLQRGSADFAWVDLHYQLMSGITLLFLVWKNKDARSKAKRGWTSFKNCLMQWAYVLDRLAQQWERIARARDVLTRLVDTTVDILEKEMCNRLSASDVHAFRQTHALRMSRNKTIIRQLGSPGASGREENSNPTETQATSSQGHLQMPASTQERQEVLSSPQQIPPQRSCYDTPSIDTPIISASRAFDDLHSQNENIYGFPASPQWVPCTQGLPASQLSPLASLQMSGMECPPMDLVELLNQQAWQGLEIYESWGAMPENAVMLNHLSAPVPDVNEGGGFQTETRGRPDSLTNSILNF